MSRPSRGRQDAAAPTSVLRTTLAAVTVLAALLVTVPLAAAAPTAPGVQTAPASDDAFSVEITVTEVSPQVLEPGADLVVTATLHNTGTTPVVEPRVLVHLDRSPYISRSSLDRWRKADPWGDAGRAVLTHDLTTPLPPGATATVRATVPAASVDLPARADSWGARALAVQVVDAADSSRVRLGLARTFALWFPPQDVTATRVSVLAPVVGGPVDPHTDAWVPELDELTGDGGRLSALLAATADHPDVTWAIDPWLAEVTQPADDPDGEPGEDEPAGDEGAVAGPDARDWAERLTAAMTDREVLLLPFGDSDLAALAHAGAREVLDAARERAAEVAAATALPDSARTSVAWPADPLPDLATAGLVAGGGDGAIVVGPGELPAPSVLTYTPTGRTTVSTASGQVVALLADDRLSTALTTGFVRSRTDADPSQVRPDGAEDPADDVPEEVWDGHLSPATAAQDLLAELAVITRERPNDARHMLLTVPRDWDPDPDVVSAQLEALEAAPWVRPEPVAALIGAAGTGVDRGTLPERQVAGSEISAAAIEAVHEAVTVREGLARMLQDPQSVLGDRVLEVLAPVSVAWRSDPDGRRAVIEGSVAANRALRSAISAEPGSPVNLISTSGELPVRVSNTLDQPVTIEVMLRPGDARLLAEDAVTGTIPAAGEAVISVPVHAIQSADLGVRVELRTPEGVVVDDSTVLTVRVRAEWEGIGTAIIGGLLAIGVVIGVIRTIRRGRAGSRAAPIDSGPDALSPEEAGP